MRKIILPIIVATFATLNVTAQEMIRVGSNVFRVDKVKSITYGKSTRQLPDVMKSDGKITLFSEAVQATHLADSLYAYKDRSYGFVSAEAMTDSCYWSNNNLCFHSGFEYDNVAYPNSRLTGFTVFTVPDDVFRTKYGVESLSDMDELAHFIYDAVYPQDAGVKDMTDRRNALNRFVSYHILPFSASYNELTACDGMSLQNNFNRRRADISEWYETLMPNSIMKFSFPSGTDSGLYINRRGVQNHADYYGVFVRGSQVVFDVVGEFKMQKTLNGNYFYLDDIAAYDVNTQKVVLNERIRIEASCLSPDFVENNTFHTYGLEAQGPDASRNGSHARGFKGGWVRNFEYKDEDTHLHVRSRVPQFWSYCGDDLFVSGANYDVTLRLPSLPAGKYEVRIGTTVGMPYCAGVSFYLDGNLVCENVNFQNGALPGLMPLYTVRDMSAKYYPQFEAAVESAKNQLESGELTRQEYEEQLAVAKNMYEQRAYNEYGFRPDFSKVKRVADPDNPNEYTETYDCDGDYMRFIRQTGWMNGPKSYSPGLQSVPISDSNDTFADLNLTVRRIIGTFETDGESEHYLRFTPTTPGEMDTMMMFSYIELVPSTIYDNPDLSEDWW